MAEEEEVEKYKRLYEEQKAKVKELERQNLQLKDVVQQLMAAGRQGGNKGLPASASAAAAAAGVAGGDARGGGPRGARTRPGGSRTTNTPGPPQGGRGRGNGSAHQRGGGGGGGGQANSTASSERGGQDSQGYASATGAAAVAAAAAAARATKAAEPPEPLEPDVRSEIVAQMREASMSKDKEKLEGAIKKAEEAGLHFEANQGRRQLGRITG